MPLAVVFLGCLLVVFSAFATAGPAGAEPVEAVAEEVADDGIYVARGRTADFDTAQWTSVIAEAAAEGIQMIVLAPAESIPNDRAFALRVRQKVDADVAILFGLEGGVEASVREELSSDSHRALAAAREATDPGTSVAAYLDGLLIEPERKVPEVVRTIALGVFLLVVILGVIVFIELAMRQREVENQSRVGRRTSH